MRPSHRHPPHLKIAIIGAGVAGLAAAHRLREMGYRNITLYEREPVAGGKVCSYLHEGHAYELGALWSSPRYRVSGRLAREVGATSRGARLPAILEAGALRTYGAYVRHHFRGSELAAEFFHLCKALSRYPGVAAPELHSLGAGSADSFESFSRREGFSRVALMASSFFSGCGYLQNDAVPTPYLMKLMHIFIDVLLLDVSGLSRARMRVFESGWQSLWLQLARAFDVRYSSHIVSVERGEEAGRPWVEVAADGATETYDRLLIAAPLEACGGFLDLGEEERDLFSRIRTHPFRVTLVEGENLPHASLMDNAPRARVGHVNLIVRQHPETSVFSIYQQLDASISEERASFLMHQDVRAMGGTISCVITSKTWRYFPHVATEDIRDGFYPRMDRLQGVRGTFYLGSVMSMETVEHTARFSVDLVERHF